VKLEEQSNELKVLVFRDAESKLTFYFRESDSKTDNVCIIPITFYVASSETKAKKDRKIEYQAKFTLTIIIQDPSGVSTNTSTGTTNPSSGSSTGTSTVTGTAKDCQTIERINKDLARLYYEIKESKQSNLSVLKQKYEDIKKKVADPNYKKCKDYEAFIEWCGVIDAQLKK
jgi:hypothetical protein